MSHPRVMRIAWMLLAGAVAPTWLSGQIAIDNITDKATYTDRTWFRVNSAAGYVYDAWLDGVPVPVDRYVTNSTPDYHELFVRRVQDGTGTVTTDLRRFVIRSSNRGEPETGLMEWLPYPLVPSTAGEGAGATLHVVAPQAYPEDLPIPVVAWVDDGQGHARRVNGMAAVSAHASQTFPILRGHGSTVLPGTSDNDPVEMQVRLHSMRTNKLIMTDAAPSWEAKGGVLSGAHVWSANSRIHITGHVGVPAGSSLTIEAGTVVKLNRFMTMTNRGTITIRGTTEQPVVFTATGPVAPDDNTYAWGGFIIRGSSARFTANGAVFNGGGGGVNFGNELGPSHKSHQAVFILSDQAQVALTNCYILNTAGQMGNAENANITMDHCLAQKAVTGGEYAGGTHLFNHSAVIEFPEHNGQVNPTIAEYDYDALYFTVGTHIIANSLVGFCKDDALDSGSGGSGTMWVSNSWVEGALHEALAWSGEGRVTHTYNTVAMNSGQGIECGWSTGANSPLVDAGNLLSLNNSVGARYGDNYDWTYNGRLTVTNSFILNNHRDIWGRVWDSSWSYRTAAMNLHDNFVTTENTNHPNNTLWNPATDGWRLAAFMTTPANAPVGIGFVVWTNQFAMSTLAGGAPVGLSTFTTNAVSVDYDIADAGGALLESGRLTFEAGEVVKRIYAAGFVAQNHTMVRVTLRDAANGELTGVTNVTYLGALGTPQVSLEGVSAGVMPGQRLVEGAFLWLNAASVGQVSVDYTFSTSGVAVATGTFVFDPPGTWRSLLPDNFNPFDYRLVDLAVSNPTGAVLVGTTSASFTNPPLAMGFGALSNQMSLDTLSNGVPIVLTGPAPDGVTVDFVMEGAGGVLTNGTVAFPSGQTTALLTAPTVDQDQQDLLRITLSNSVKVPLEGITTLYLVRTVPPLPAGPDVTLVRRGSRWRYEDNASAAPAGWTGLAFDHSAWPEGPAQLGYGESDQATLLTSRGKITCYFRHLFEVTNAAEFASLSLWLLRDDGGVVYLNGTEVFRSPNLPAYPTAIAFNTTTLSGQNGENTIDTKSDLTPNLQAGTNVVAVEIHQQSNTSSDLSFDFELVGTPVPPSSDQEVYVGRFGDEVVFGWTDAAYVLEEADTVDGAWTVVGQGSPLVIPSPGPGQKFYRLHKR
ncbi:MAG: hypothetical protein JXQ71_18040 [Verrucomicrobia bacterium]|nr:hypothetical protein [Verrucomicrobiota bacterium]